MAGLGDEFRATREARHLSLSDVAERLHIRSVYLESIEDEEWAVIGAPVYVRGFLRSYARFLGLEPEKAVERYNAAIGTTAPPSSRAAAAAAEAGFDARSRTKPGRRGGASPVLWLAVLAAAVLVGFVGYNLVGLRGTHVATSRVAEASPAPSSAASAVPSPVETPAQPKPLATRTLEVELTQTSWLLVTVDGVKRLEGTYPAGTTKSFRGKVANVRAGNAGGVDLQVNGKQLGAMGHDGDVVQRRVPLIEE